MFAHQQYNMPQSIQARNKEIIDEKHKQREKELEEKNKFKRFKPTVRTTTTTNGEEVKSEYADESTMEINEYYEVDEGGKVRGEKKEDLKFTPRPPPPKEYLPTPIGRNHTRGPKISPLAQKCFNLILYLAFIYSSLYNMLIL